MRRVTGFGIALFVTAVAVIAVNYDKFITTRSYGPTSIRLGILFPFTGDAAAWGTKGRKGVQLAIDLVNQSNSCGRHLDAVFEDSAAQPSTGLSAFQKLATVDRVPAVIGDIVSSVTLAVAPIAERAKTVLLSPTASAPAITSAGEYVYRIWPSDLAEGHAIANFALQAGYKRVAILYLNNDYGLGIKNAFADTFSQGGGRVALSEGYQESAQDFRDVLSKINNSDADVIYIAGYYTDTAIVVRQARELRLKLQMLGTTAVQDEKFLEISRSAAEGIIFPLATGYDADSSNAVVHHFVESFRARFNEPPGFIEAQAFDAVEIICKAIKTLAGPVDGERIKLALDKLEPFDGVTGEIKFDQNGDVTKPIRIRTVKDGKFTDLKRP